MKPTNENENSHQESRLFDVCACGEYRKDHSNTKAKAARDIYTCAHFHFSHQSVIHTTPVAAVA